MAKKTTTSKDKDNVPLYEFNGVDKAKVQTLELQGKEENHESYENITDFDKSFNQYEQEDYRPHEIYLGVIEQDRFRVQNLRPSERSQPSVPNYPPPPVPPPVNYYSGTNFGYAVSPENRGDQSGAQQNREHTTIRDLKAKLGEGMGLRTNKYILELDPPRNLNDNIFRDREHNIAGTNNINKFIDGRTLNILCNSISFPKRGIGVVSMFRFGRKYNLRSESNFDGTFSLRFVDDSSFSLYKFFHAWINSIDDVGLQNDGPIRRRTDERPAYNYLGRVEAQYMTDIVV